MKRNFNICEKCKFLKIYNYHELHYFCIKYNNHGYIKDKFLTFDLPEDCPYRLEQIVLNK